MQTSSSHFMHDFKESRMARKWLHNSLARVTGMMLISVVLISVSWSIKASDHADTAENFNRIGADMTDVFIFPSPENDDNVVLVMDVHGLIPAGQGASF